MSTPSLTPSPPPAGDPLTVPDRPAAKAGLLLLVLLMLGLLLWQMSQELRQQERFEHERAAAQLDRLNDRLSLTLELKARTALALLPGVPPSERGEIQNRLLPRISDALPQVRQLQWVDSAPQTGSPSPETTLPEQLRQHAGSGLYHYCLDPRDGESLYLTLREPGSRRDSGFWLLHLASDSLAQWSPDLPTGNLLWRLEDQYAGRVLWHTPGSTALLDDMQTLGVEPLRNSDWQLRGLYDSTRVRLGLLPGIGGELAIFLLLVGVTVYMLLRLHREQQGLRAMTLASQRSLRQAATALAAIDERVLVTRADGRLSYLNPQAERLFGISSAQARQHHLLGLLPDLEPGWLTDAGGDGETRSELLPLRVRGEPRTSPSAAIRWPAIRRSPTRPGPSASRSSRAGRSGCCATSPRNSTPSASWRKPGGATRTSSKGSAWPSACSTSPPCARLWWSKAWTAAPHCAPGSPANPGGSRRCWSGSASPRSTMSVAACYRSIPPNRPGSACSTTARYNRTACACR